MNRLGITAAFCAATLSLAACSSPETSTTVGGLDAQRAFARMKQLAGSYEGSATGVEGTTKVSYEVTSGGHALLEKLAEGSEREMTSVYYLEGLDLAMVHYCAMGNRPHLRLDRASSTLEDLRFTWDGTASDIDPAKDGHIHAARFACHEPGKVEATWTFWQDGKESHQTTFTLERTSEPAADATVTPTDSTTPPAPATAPATTPPATNPPTTPPANPPTNPPPHGN